METSHRPALAAGISLYDARPFFEKALRHGLAHGIIDQQKLAAICADAPKGMVQIARYFGNEFLRPDIEKARDRIVNLVSLCLEQGGGGNLQQAAEALRDHSFLSRSKCGSDLLKALLALPENTGFHADLDAGLKPQGEVPKGLAIWSLKSFADYQAELARRLPVQREKNAAIWLAEHLGLDVSELEEAGTHAEAVIRTAVLVAALGGVDMPDWIGFDNLVTRLRQQHLANKTAAAAAGNKPRQATAASICTIAARLVAPPGLPANLEDVVSRLATSVAADLPRMLDSAVSTRTLFANDSLEDQAPLLGRYFWLEDIASELQHHESATAVAWDRATGGNHDDGSLLTLWLCLAAGLAPQTLLTEKNAKDLVRRLQKPGGIAFDPEIARGFIQAYAPAQYQEGYLALWNNFLEEALPVLHSDAPFALQDALALLRRECHVKA